MYYRRLISENLTSLAVITLLLISVPLTLTLIGQRQDIRNRAASPLAHLRLSNNNINVNDVIVVTVSAIPANTAFVDGHLSFDTNKWEIVPASKIIKITNAVIFRDGIFQYEDQSTGRTALRLFAGAHNINSPISGDLFEVRLRAKTPGIDLPIWLSLNSVNTDAQPREVRETAYVTITTPSPTPDQPSPSPLLSPTLTPTPIPPHQCVDYLTNCYPTQTPCPPGQQVDSTGSCEPGRHCCLGTPIPTSTPTSHQCVNYWTNCINVNNSCPAGKVDDSLGTCGPGFKCCKETTAPTPTPNAPTPTTGAPTATPSTAASPTTPPTAPTNTPIPTPTHQCVDYWTNCINVNDSCPAGKIIDPLGACGPGFKCCK